MLVVVGAHQRQGVVQEVSPCRHHALASRQQCGCSPEIQKEIVLFQLYVLVFFFFFKWINPLGDSATSVLPECGGWPPPGPSCARGEPSAARREAGGWGGRGLRQTTEPSRTAAGPRWSP